MFLRVAVRLRSKRSVDHVEMMRRRGPLLTEPVLMSNKAAVATSAGVLIPWGNPLIDVVDSECEQLPRCAKCGLLASFNALGYGENGDVCLDCNNEANEVVQRLRSYRAA